MSGGALGDELSPGEVTQDALFGGINIPVGMPLRVTAVGTCPTGQSTCKAGSPVMLGTYVVQLYAGAVTALSIRGRRPWQP